MIKAEVEYDDQHGPIVTVRTAEETVSVYLCAETGVVTTEKGQYGLEVSGPWFKVRAVLCPEGGAYRDYLLRENRLLREELAEANESLRAELSAYREDAERYRWLRNRIPGSAYRIAGIIYSEGGVGVDAGIDKARKGEGEA